MKILRKDFRGGHKKSFFTIAVSLWKMATCHGAGGSAGTALILTSLGLNQLGHHPGLSLLQAVHFLDSPG